MTRSSSSGAVLRAALAAVGWLARHALPFVAAGAAAGLLHAGRVRWDAWGIAASAIACAILMALPVREWILTRREGQGGRRPAGSAAPRALVELRLLAPIAVAVEVSTGLFRSAGLDLGAISYLFALVAVTFFSRSASVPALLVSLLAGWAAGGGPLGLDQAELSRRVATSLFLCFFGGFGLAFLRSEIVRIRREGQERIEAKLRDYTEQARDYRLITAPSSQPAEAIDDGCEEERGEEEERREEMLGIAHSLDEIHSTNTTMLDVARRTMRLHTAVLLLTDDAGEYLRIVEASTGSSCLADAAIPIGYGVTGAVLAHGKTLALCPLDSEKLPVPYYCGPEGVRSFCAVPVHDRGQVRGVLCADRLTEDPFRDQDVEVLASIAKQGLRVAANERLFLQLVKAKTEQSRLYRSSMRFREANGVEDVIRAAFDSARSIVQWDMAAATRVDPEKRRHAIVSIAGDWDEDPVGIEWKENEGLVSQACRMRHHLPYKGSFDERNQIVFTRKVRIRGMQSLLVLPLVAGDRAAGTIVLASRRQAVFTRQVRILLQVIADQAALSWENAIMVRKLEDLATRDGLTGLLNRRVFQEALSRKMAEARRSGTRLSLIMSDLDHFKSVNDTHGHQAGDLVLTRFAAVIRRNVREVDLACRYGGEEFVVVCPDTDGPGALLLAERIRREMEREEMDSGAARIRVTCSLGVATYPEHAGVPDALVAAADESLYEAKHGGRNRVVVASTGLARAS